MKFSNIPTAYVFMQLAKQNEITDVVISPGSRNAPLALSFTLNDDFNAYSIIDERAKRIREAKEAAEQARREAIKRHNEMMETVKIGVGVGSVVLAAVAFLIFLLTIV